MYQLEAEGTGETENQESGSKFLPDTTVKVAVLQAICLVTHKVFLAAHHYF